jgi:AraC family transcriptional regulator, regulatory protein of adaptative response / DNA-3-methyladenine glycosylase II
VTPGAAGALSLRLPYREPLDADALIAFFARRAVPGVEELAGGAYRRSLRLPHGAGVAELRATNGELPLTLWLDDERDADAAAGLCRGLFDLDTDPAPIARRLGSDRLIGALVRESPGRRVPGHVDGPELAIRAVLGQQVSLAGAATLAGRLVADYGEPLARPIGAVTHVFPTAAALAAADPERLAMPGARRRALLGLAAALASGEVVLDARAGRAAAEEGLLALPGIGPWTVSYISMRVLRDPDAFMPSDLGVRHALERLGEDGSPASATRIAERWRPYRAYALLHLWAALAG